MFVECRQYYNILIELYFITYQQIINITKVNVICSNVLFYYANIFKSTIHIIYIYIYILIISWNIILIFYLLFSQELPTVITYDMKL